MVGSSSTDCTVTITADINGDSATKKTAISYHLRQIMNNQDAMINTIIANPYSMNGSSIL
jgi:hypothetical protein